MADQHSNVQLYRRLPSDSVGDDVKHDLAAVSDDEPLFNKPTLLCCGGMMNNAHHKDGEKNANGLAKLGHGLLGLEESGAAAQNIDVLTTLYPQSTDALDKGLHDHTRNMLEAGNSQKSTAFAAEFALKYLIPLVQDASGNALDVTVAKKQLRNINILAVSYGATFAQQLGNELANRMEEIGYSKEDIADITSQILVLTAGPVAPLAAGKASFTTLDIINFGDTQITNLYPVVDMLKDTMAQEGMLVNRQNKIVSKKDLFINKIHRYDQLPAKPLTAIPIKLDQVRDGLSSYHKDSDSRSMVVCASQFPKTNDFNGNILSKPHIEKRMWRSGADGKFNVEKPRLLLDDTGHQPTTYLNYGLTVTPEESGQHGFMLRSAACTFLANGINNSIRNNAPNSDFEPLPTPQELLKLPQKLEYEVPEGRNFIHIAAPIGYEERIADASQARGR